MRIALHKTSDYALGLFLPKAKVGACPCQPGVCGSWVTIGDC